MFWTGVNVCMGVVSVNAALPEQHDANRRGCRLRPCLRKDVLLLRLPRYWYPY